MSLEDAAWHLACLANIDFCKVNVEYNNVQFDTIKIQINVTDDIMLIDDIRSAYEQICTEIQLFKKRLKYCDQNLYFINVCINENGNAKIAIMTTFNSISKDIYDHTWYFEDYWDASETCDEYFSYDSTYYWNSTASRELERVLNLFEHHANIPGAHGVINICYIPSRNHTFDYNDYTYTYDPYGSYYHTSSRVYAYKRRANDNSMDNYALPMEEMCYCLDSYLGLGYEFVNTTLYPNEHPVCWKVIPFIYQESNSMWNIYYHQLIVEFGQLIPINPPAPY